MKSTNFN